MIRATVSIANAHDGVALETDTAEGVATAVEFALLFGEFTSTVNPSAAATLREVANILRGLRRDGSKPEGEAS